jgi:hypothetical protein
MRDLKPLVRLIATFLFGLSVLALLCLLSTQMAARYFRGSAERAVRQVFVEGTQTRSGVSYSALCRGSEFGGERASECDPIAVKAKRSLRSTACSPQGFANLPGSRWECLAKFTDGAILSVRVSLGFGRRHLELILPFREPDA